MWLLLTPAEDNVRTGRVGSGVECIGGIPRALTVVDPDAAEIVAEARLKEPARVGIQRNARRFNRPVMRRHAQRLFGVHPDAAEIVAEARRPRVLSARGARPTALAVLRPGHAQRLFGKLIGPLFAGVLGLTPPDSQPGFSCRDRHDISSSQLSRRGPE